MQLRAEGGQSARRLIVVATMIAHSALGNAAAGVISKVAAIA